MRINSTQVKRSLLTALSVAFLVGVTGQGVAHAAANPLLAAQASASGFAAGAQIYDSATLGQGVNPTGWMTWRLYAPVDTTCSATPLLNWSTAVTGNGYYESPRFATVAAGTYRWTAAYSGDVNNNPSATTPCGAPSGEVSVSRRMPVLDAAPTWSAPSATATAQVAGGVGPSGPTGQVTFNLYGPGDMTCAAGPVFTYTRSVAGNGSFPSAPYTPKRSGTYQWVVTYTGDANNYGTSTTCSDTSNGFTATAAGGTVVSGSPTTVSRGGTITVTWSAISNPTSGDWVGLYAIGTADGGSVTAWKYLTGAAGGSVSLKFPWSAAADDYEVRLMADNSITRLATSSPVNLVW